MIKLFRLMAIMLVLFLLTAVSVQAKVAVLTWDALVDPPSDFAGYRLYQAEGSGKDIVFNPVKDILAGSEPTTTVDVDGDQDYSWALSTFDASGNESAMCEAFSLTLDTTPPPVPTGFRAVWQALVSFLHNLFWTNKWT